MPDSTPTVLPPNEPATHGSLFSAAIIRGIHRVARGAWATGKIGVGAHVGDPLLIGDGCLEVTGLLLDRAANEVRQETGTEPHPEKLGLDTGIMLARKVAGADQVLQRVWWRVLKRAMAESSNDLRQPLWTVTFFDGSSHARREGVFGRANPPISIEQFKCMVKIGLMAGGSRIYDLVKELEPPKP